MAETVTPMTRETENVLAGVAVLILLVLLGVAISTDCTSEVYRSDLPACADTRDRTARECERCVEACGTERVFYAPARGGLVGGTPPVCVCGGVGP